MTGVSEKRFKVIVRSNQQEMATPHHENDQDSALPKPKKPSDQMRYKKYAASLPTRASG
jgi:hypothetical protein